MSASTRVRATRANQQQVVALVATIRKQESEIDNLKDFCLKLAARVLRLELEVSVLDKDTNSLHANLYQGDKGA